LPVVRKDGAWGFCRHVLAPLCRRGRPGPWAQSSAPGPHRDNRQRPNALATAIALPQTAPPCWCCREWMRLGSPVAASSHSARLARASV
jgi:hypothetical protein